jgi:NADPH:quinone reductase-like Zn-dependent oxidoreductase
MGPDVHENQPLSEISYMSRVVEFSEAGGPEVLRFKDVDVPEAGLGQMRIRVKAIGLNRAESMWRHNDYIEPVKFPARLGYEAVGTVDSARMSPRLPLAMKST